MISVKLNGLVAKVESFVFPGGEIGERVENPCSVRPTRADITCLPKNSDDIMELLMVKDALSELLGVGSISSLFLNYLPYARQDRVCNRGEALSLRVMCNLINSMGFDEVVLYDPRNGVAGAMINNCAQTSQLGCFILTQNSWRIDKYDIVVAPNAGAGKKAFALAQFLGAELVQANKRRDLSSGKIVKTEIDTLDMSGKNILVVDDICDGGMSFIKLGEEIRKQTNDVTLDLYITYGIFSKGKEVLHSYDNIYCMLDWNQIG